MSNRDESKAAYVTAYWAGKNDYFCVHIFGSRSRKDRLQKKNIIAGTILHQQDTHEQIREALTVLVLARAGLGSLAMN
jgi:hypothetical protein